MPVTASPPIYALLPSVQEILIEHPHDADGRSLRCRGQEPCDHLDTAIDTLDLVLRTHYRRRTSPGG